MTSYERLSVQDRLHLDLEDRDVQMQVAGVFVFEAGPLLRENGGVDIERVRDYLESKLFLIPRYRQRLAWIPLEDHPAWVDDPSFNLQYHVRHTHLPVPGDERQLKRLVGRIFSQHLDRGKPLWELWVVEGLEHERIALVLKVHHCMVDGIASTELLQMLLSAEPQKSFDPPPVWLPRPVPESRELLEGALRRRLATPLEVGSTLLRAVRKPRRTLAWAQATWESLRLALDAQASTVSDTPLNLPIGPHRRFDWLGFDVAEVKRVKRELGGTLNDVVLAVVAGGVGAFFEQRGVTPREQVDLDFRVACPMSTRRAVDDGRFGNHVSSLIVPLPLGEPDPRRRLARVREATRNLKANHQERAVELAQTLSESLARGMIEGHATNLVVFDVPGPRAPLYLLGARMLEAYPQVPLLPDQALGVACISYSGGLFWGFNADWESVPDLHDLVVAIDCSFRELCAAAEGG
jgi:WS/DGAT/MGAT family acyltransferase